MEKKGEITFFFDKKNLDLTGWEIIDLNRNITNFKIINLVKNEELGKKFFKFQRLIRDHLANFFTTKYMKMKMRNFLTSILSYI